MNKRVEQDFKTLNGEITVPADKSMSHRAVIFSSLARGKSIITNFSDGQDPYSSLEICRNLGVDIEISDSILKINSSGKLNSSFSTLNCRNSGTTMRLMTGVLASQNFNSNLIGDESLSKRPMKRIINPLMLMGAKIQSEDYHAPLKIFASHLSGINYESPIASAQVKSCMLLAGLNAEGKTIYKEPYLSRNHSEILLKHMGASIIAEGTTVSIEKSELEPININIFGDISSAAFFIVATLIVPGAKILLKNVGLNPTRSGIIDVVQKMGATIEILDKRNVCGEIVGDIKVEYSNNLRTCKLSGELIPRLIDEIPIICVLATQVDGETVIKDAQDLRNKESDRISAIVNELKKLGADIEETSDGMKIRGKKALTGGIEVESYRDHRLAMSLYVAGLITREQISIKDFDWVNISFPTFEKLVESLKI